MLDKSSNKYVIKSMDNPSFQHDVETGTELGTVKKMAAPGTSACRQEVCQAARRRFPPPDLDDTTSSWHKYKSIAFFTLILLFSAWVIVYATLNHFNLL